MIYRIDVRTTPLTRGGEAAVDPVGEAVRHQIAEFGRTVGPVSTRRIFLIDSDATPDQVRSVATQLLADPVVEQADLVLETPNDHGSTSRIEIHLKPGVMDPVAASTEMAIRDMGIPVREVRTGRAYLIDGQLPPEGTVCPEDASPFGAQPVAQPKARGWPGLLATPGAPPRPQCLRR